MEERQKTLVSNERKTVRETCKMKKATCGQFRVHERNFTCTAVTSPRPNALAALSCEQTALSPSPWDQYGPGYSGPTQRLLDEQSRTTLTQTKVGCGTQEAKQKHNLWRTDHTWAHGLPSSSFCSSSGSSGSPAGPDIALGLRHTGDPGSKCFFRCITQPLESSDFRATEHRLLLLKGTSLLRSDTSSINLRHSPLSPRQRQWNIATHWVLVSFVWPTAEWHGKTKKSYEQTTLT